MTEPMKTLTIKQPWATLIAKGVKDVENRTWHTNYRGLVAIHAGKAYDAAAHFDPVAAASFVDDDRVRRLHRSDLPAGSIIAVAELVDVHSYKDEACRSAATGAPCSLWAQPGAVHWRLEDVRELNEPIEWPGSLGLRLLSPETAAIVLAATERTSP